MSVPRREPEGVRTWVQPFGFRLRRDDRGAGGARLDFKHTLFIDRTKTADYQTTYEISNILRRKGNKEDIIAFLEE